MSTSLPDAPQPQLSPLRVLIAIVLLLVVGTGGYFAFRHITTTEDAQADAATRQATWFAPYVDATLTPTVAFQDKAANPSKNVVLGFVVASTANPCTPSWGTYASLDQAADTLDLDRRITQVRGQGGDAVISFGGQANTELAVACDEPTQLAAAYQSVVSRYSATTIDFDIEGTALDDTAANARRAQAVKTLQATAKAKGHRLNVWLTLPVTTHGLNANALAVVQSMLAAKVDLAGVNVMAMDFGEPAAAKDMRTAVLGSVTATRPQLAALYARTGSKLSSQAQWAKLGVTVMIGQNDVAAERFSVADARAVAAFAAGKGLARVSMWSLNRDQPCGATFSVVGTHSNVCSGAAQKPLDFSKALARLRGSTAAKAATATDAVPDATTSTVDDPATSPFPIWDPQQPYREGYKVVWHKAVYVAKWYSQGQTPDSTTIAATDSPWRLVGPVLKTDRAPKVPTLPAGTYPEWKPATVFKAGAKVLFEGLPYQASWYTVGDVPGEPGENGTLSPWKALYTVPGEPEALTL